MPEVTRATAPTTVKLTEREAAILLWLVGSVAGPDASGKLWLADSAYENCPVTSEDVRAFIGDLYTAMRAAERLQT